ncbi:alpha/beta hydrolase [Pedobacter petrophilus]|uniref:Alpha/beta hydrolase n=1 Tax=Pedobacter petrophilus TaxID=1908241 RepID=A0A7K0G1I6_9SPHI|nr:alpha/beta hydrolase [Pedobacter petrophilus]MRX77310.1 alpha/beta hydrolase [Pedobacter petrophilus]
MNAYFISGLGADKRIFTKIKLHEHINVIHVDWIPPYQNETLPNYAKRLSAIINTNQPYILVGVSFGGMIAVEISKILKPLLTIAISSTIVSSELPFLYRLAGSLGLIKIIPSALIKSSNRFSQNLFFGTKTMEEKRLLTKIINDTQPAFLKWAIGSILTWQNTIRPDNLVLIHGTSDRILYSRAAKVDYTIDKGTHFMVYQNAEEISELIDKLVSRYF